MEWSVNPNGSLPSVIWDFITAHGLNLVKDDMKTSTHTSDGHQALRTLTDCLIAQQWSKIIQRCLRLTTPRDRSRIIINAIGDKFCATTTNLDTSLEWKDYMLYPTTEENADAVDGYKDTFRADVEAIR